MVQYSTFDVSNIPEKTPGELLTFGGGLGYCAQIYTPLYNTKDHFWYRVSNADSGFSHWIKIAETKDTKPYTNLLCAYDNIIACGDSLTWGQVYTSTGSRQAKKPWPMVVAAESHNNPHIFATPGYTAESWYKKYHEQAIIPRDNQIFVIYLGTNAGLKDSVNSDCPSALPSTQWATTQTGYYGRILDEIIRANAKAVLIVPHSTTGNITQTRKAIKDFGTRFNFPVIDDVYVSDNAYHRCPGSEDYNWAHYNDIGYVALAYNIINELNNLDDTEKNKIFS